MTWVPQACTLPTAEQPVRVAEFDSLFAATVRPPERPTPTRLRLFLAGPDAAALAEDLIEREASCCSFFSFALRASTRECELDVQVPESQVEVLDAMQVRAEAARRPVPPDVSSSDGHARRPDPP